MRTIRKLVEDLSALVEMENDLVSLRRGLEADPDDGAIRLRLRALLRQADVEFDGVEVARKATAAIRKAIDADADADFDVTDMEGPHPHFNSAHAVSRGLKIKSRRHPKAHPIEVAVGFPEFMKFDAPGTLKEVPPEGVIRVFAPADDFEVAHLVRIIERALPKATVTPFKWEG